MKERDDSDWHLHAWEFNRQHGFPGSVELVKKAMQFGYKLGLCDSTQVLAEVREKITTEKERSNAPR